MTTNNNEEFTDDGYERGLSPEEYFISQPTSVAKYEFFRMRRRVSMGIGSLAVVMAGLDYADDKRLGIATVGTCITGAMYAGRSIVSRRLENQTRNELPGASFLDRPHDAAPIEKPIDDTRPFDLPLSLRRLYDQTDQEQ